MAGAYPNEAPYGSTLYVKLQALLATGRIGWKGVSVTIHYNLFVICYSYDEKSLITLTPVIKLIFSLMFQQNKLGCAFLANFLAILLFRAKQGPQEELLMVIHCRG